MKALKKAEKDQSGSQSPGDGGKADLALEPLAEDISITAPSSSPARAAASLMLEQDGGGSRSTIILLALLGLVIAGMGGYFYIEISHPTLLQFASRPQIAPAVAPPPARPAAAPVIAAPAVQPDIPAPNQAAPHTIPAAPLPAADKEETLRVIPGGAPAAVAPGLMSAYQSLQEGRYEQARAAYERMLQAEPRNLDVLLGLAAVALNQGRSEQAGQYYLRALELDPRNAPAQAGLITLVGNSDPAGSEARLKQLIAQHPAAFLYVALGNLQAGQSNWPSAQQAYFDAFRLEPGSADYAFNLAVSLDHLNQPKQALEYYQRAQNLANGKTGASFDPIRLKTRILQLQRNPE